MLYMVNSRELAPYGRSPFTTMMVYGGWNFNKWFLGRPLRVSCMQIVRSFILLQLQYHCIWYRNSGMTISIFLRFETLYVAVASCEMLYVDATKRTERWVHLVASWRTRRSGCSSIIPDAHRNGREGSGRYALLHQLLEKATTVLARPNPAVIFFFFRLESPAAMIPASNNPSVHSTSSVRCPVGYDTPHHLVTGT